MAAPSFPSPRCFAHEERRSASVWRRGRCWRCSPTPQRPGPGRRIEPAWLHGALAGAPTWLLAAALAVSLRPGRAAQALLQVLAVSSLASVLAVLLIPHWAVAGPQDVLGASAPGDWRGLYGHKNTLGHVAGLAAAALCARGGRLVRPRWLRWAGLASAVACVLASRSISGMALAAGLPLLDRLLRSGGLVRACAAAFATAALAALFAARALVLSAGLAALGRDATLSGRTAIWRAAGELIGHRPLAGWGLDYSVSTGVQTRLTALFGVNHVHNAMLDVFINLGAVGLLLAAAAVLGALWTGSDGSQRVPRSDVAAAAALRLLVLGWLLSGVSEDMAVRADGPMAQIGLCALFALYRLGAGRGSFRRPRFSFRPAWRAPLRPPRLPAAPCG